MPLTLAEAREEVADAIGVCSDDARVAQYVNKAVRRLLPKGKWKGTYARVRFCVNNACITLPRAIETVESYALCGVPGTIRNSWFEFLIGGPGVWKDCSDDDDCGGSSCVGNQMMDRREHPGFDDIQPDAINRKIRVYADVGEDAGATILLQGVDENGNWIRTQDGSTWIDGEKVAISTTPTLSTKFFTKLSRVIKPVTNGPVRLYEYNNDTAANVKALAVYEPDETLPSYRRMFIPIASHVSGSGDCDTSALDAMVKLRFIPVSVDNDFIIIENLPAIVEMARAVRKYENNLFQEAIAYEALAVKYLNEELMHHLGDGPVVQMRVESRSTFGAGIVENPIS